MPDAGKPVALVTGGSDGIGRALAVRLAREGYVVAIMGRRPELLQAACHDIDAAGGEGASHAFRVDLTDRGAFPKKIDDVVEKLGRVDLFVANAGTAGPSSARHFDAREAQRVIDLNVSAFMAGIAHVLPPMLERRSGHIVAVSSLAAFRGLPKSAVYCATKAFVSTFMESFRGDLKGTGVFTTTVHPGFVRTALNAGAKNLPFIMTPERAADAIWKAIKRKAPNVAFPFPLAAPLAAARLLPNGLYERFF
ncbi:MAG: SDR family NAD(P)-dependent oxidoreductase [Deltaproteobacteria bacterium]|nr:SDR family NAD(P)-dependent oxidoreductase [Deltaproteobacteria bacterium]